MTLSQIFCVRCGRHIQHHTGTSSKPRGWIDFEGSLGNPACPAGGTHEPPAFARGIDA